MKNKTRYSDNLNYSLFILIILLLCHPFKCYALDSNEILKINKSINLAINSYLMVSLNDSLLCGNNLKQIDIINTSDNRYDNLGRNHNFESIKFDKNGILNEINGDYINIDIEENETNLFYITYRNKFGEVFNVTIVEIRDLNVKISTKDYFLFFIPNNKITCVAQFNEKLDFTHIKHPQVEEMFYYYFGNYQFTLTINSQIQKIYRFDIFNFKDQNKTTYVEMLHNTYRPHSITPNWLCFKNSDNVVSINNETCCYGHTLDFFNLKILSIEYNDLNNILLIQNIFNNLIELLNSEQFFEVNRRSLGSIEWFEKQKFDSKGLLIDHFVHTSNYRTYKISYQYW